MTFPESFYPVDAAELKTWGFVLVRVSPYELDLTCGDQTVRYKYVEMTGRWTR